MTVFIADQSHDSRPTLKLIFEINKHLQRRPIRNINHFMFSDESHATLSFIQWNKWHSSVSSVCVFLTPKFTYFLLQYVVVLLLTIGDPGLLLFEGPVITNHFSIF